MNGYPCLYCHEVFTRASAPAAIRSRTNHERRCASATPSERLHYQRTGCWPLITSAFPTLRKKEES